GSPLTGSTPGTAARGAAPGAPQAARAANSRAQRGRGSGRRGRTAPSFYTILRCDARFPPYDARIATMRRSIATRVFVGFATVLLTSASVSVYGVLQMRR